MALPNQNSIKQDVANTVRNVMADLNGKYSRGEISADELLSKYDSLYQGAVSQAGKLPDGFAAEIQSMRETMAGRIQEAKGQDIAAEAVNVAKEDDATKNRLAEDQFNWFKDLAKSDDERRQGIYQDLLSEATLTPERVNQEVGKAADYVGASYDKAAENRNRGLTSMGIDPSSGRYVSSDRQASLDKARAVGAAKGLTRYNLKTQEAQRRDNAHLAGLGITPTQLSVTDPRLGLTSTALPALTNQASFAYTSADNANNRGLTYYTIANQNNQAALDRQSQFMSDVTGGLSYAAGRYAIPKLFGG